MNNPPTLPVFNRLSADQKEVAQRQWCAPAKATVIQRPCDHGLFSDDAKQIDLFSNANKGK